MSRKISSNTSDSADHTFKLPAFSSSYRSLRLFIPTIILLFASTILLGAENPNRLSVLRLNEVQYIGTHNSYHISIGEAVAILLKAASYQASEEWTAGKLFEATDFTHPSIGTQLKLGLRQFELDVYADPTGGRFRNPSALRVLQATPWDLPVYFGGASDLEKPGFKVLHNPEYDFRSNCYLLSTCLEEIHYWSDRVNGDHFPVIIQIEVKEKGAPPITDEFDPAIVEKFTVETWRQLEQTITSVFSPEQIVTPDDIRGEYQTLREAVLTDGWPTLGELRGKVLFFLLNKKATTDSYLRLDKYLRERLFFVSASPNHPSAAWFRVPSPYDKSISRLVEQGFLVTTMADQHTIQSRNNDHSQKEQAFGSGGNFILTDYPIPDRRFSNYQVSFTEGSYIRCNPHSSKTCDIGLEVEEPADDAN